MSALAFPLHEPNFDVTTPLSAYDGIPIDPALGGSPAPLSIDPFIDPALVPHIQQPPAPEVRGPYCDASCLPFGAHICAQPLYAPPPDYFESHQPLSDDDQVRQYSQGPQGDPFAPQIPQPFFAVEEPQLPPPQTKSKRKRKASARVREHSGCWFCGKPERRGAGGRFERLLTCHECGRCGELAPFPNPRC